MRSIRLLAAATFILVVGSGCGSDGGGVEPGSDPVADFTVGTCTAGAACAFTDASTDPDGNNTITSRVWDFGDPASGALNASTDVNPSHTFGAAATYTVKLTVTDNSGKTSVKSKDLTVGGGTGNVLPVASFELPSACNAGTPCGFHSTSDDTDGDIQTWQWNFGDGSELGAGEDATHTYDNPGTFTVVLTVTDNAGGQATATQQLTVAPAASQGCTTSGTVVNCSLGLTQRVTVKLTIVSEDCQLAGDKLTVTPTGQGEQTAFFNLCNRNVGDEYIVKDATGAQPLVFQAGSTLPLRFHQGPQGTNPPVSDPGVRITGSYPNWTLNIDDGGAAGTPGEPDFNDAIISVVATPQ